MERVSVVMTMRKMKKSSLVLSLLVGMTMLTGCVDQHPNRTSAVSVDGNPLEVAKGMVDELDHPVRIVATSPAVVEICDRLDLDLVGVPNSNVTVLPRRYEDCLRIGLAMSPDMELVSSVKPDWILGPSSLISDLKPKFETLNSQYAFLNLKSVEGMYTSMDELGYLFGKSQEANMERQKYESFMKEYQTLHDGKESPKVMILMGLPGSYIIATENSYVGSLVEMAGGTNVYAGSNQEFLNVNTEDMKQRNPDIILRCAHALPDEIVKMFDEEFQTNDIWSHFKAVQEGKVYDLTYQNFGMSAKFNYPNALEELEPLLYGEEDMYEEDVE